MAKSQENGSKILLGLKDCEVEEVKEDKDRIVVKIAPKVSEVTCPHCGSLNLHRHR